MTFYLQSGGNRKPFTFKGLPLQPHFKHEMQTLSRFKAYFF